MPLLTIPARRGLSCSILLVFASWAALFLYAATEETSPSCRFSSPALSHDDDHHHHHDHDHDHDHHHHHPHDHDHGDFQSRKLPEELAEEEDLAREGFGFHHHQHQHHHHSHSNDGHEHEISPLGVWLRAMGCSLLVSMASLICLVMLPLIFFQGKPSRAVVDCLAVFGAGAMLGDAFLHQLPHAFGGKHSHSHDNHIGSFGDADHAHGHSHAHSLEDLSVGLSMLLGIVLFFLVEKIVRYAEDHSTNGSNGHHHHHHKQKQKLKHDGEDTNHQLLDSKNRETLDLASERELNGQSDAELKNDEHEKPEVLRKRTTGDGISSENEKDNDSRNVRAIQKQPSLNEAVPAHTSSNLVFGYLNLFSDGVHNFTDGMALGSAFVLHGSVGGWSRTLFLLAHELPQEVGDFGILVRSGFSASKALFFNFLSALVALLGTALALVLGKDPGQSSLIEGFTAGGFIYIAVAGVLPEMHDGKTTIKSTLVQLTSLLAGMAVALFISLIE